MDDGAECIDRFAVHENVELHEWRHTILRLGVVQRRVPLRAALQLIEVVNDQFGEWNLEAHDDALLVEVLHPLKDAALVGGELHDRADIG